MIVRNMPNAPKKERRKAPASKEGAPIPGFEEDWQFDAMQSNGVGFKALDEVLDVEREDAQPSGAPVISMRPDVPSPTRSSSPAPPGADEVSAGNPQDPNDPELISPETDLRFGGEDLSGVSEWSLRARQPPLGEAEDGAVYDRPDTEIQDELLEFFEEEGFNIDLVRCDVRGGVVTLAGNLSSRKQEELILTGVKEIPGVREVVMMMKAPE